MRKYAAHTTRGRVATHKNSFPKKLSLAIFGDSKREQAEGARVEKERGPRRLLHPDGMEAKVGEVLQSDGKKYRLVGWREPHTINSSGRVFVKRAGRFPLRGVAGPMEESFFPHVFDLKFEPECDRCSERREVNDDHLCVACAAK